MAEKKVDKVKINVEFSEENELKELRSGEGLSVLMGKLAKAVKDIISHFADSVKHVSADERTVWNGKAAGDHTHSADQISGLPSELPANGGNADTLGGLPASSFARKPTDWAKKYFTFGPSSSVPIFTDALAHCLEGEFQTGDILEFYFNIPTTVSNMIYWKISPTIRFDVPAVGSKTQYFNFAEFPEIKFVSDGTIYSASVVFFKRTEENKLAFYGATYAAKVYTGPAYVIPHSGQSDYISWRVIPS